MLPRQLTTIHPNVDHWTDRHVRDENNQLHLHSLHEKEKSFKLNDGNPTTGFPGSSANLLDLLPPKYRPHAANSGVQPPLLNLNRCHFRDTALSPMTSQTLSNVPLHIESRSQKDDSSLKRIQDMFLDILGETTVSNEVLFTRLREKLDTQASQIDCLEHALQNKVSDRKDITVSELLHRYPKAMENFRADIEAAVISKQLDQLELEKQALLDLHRRDYESIKRKYRQRFDLIVAKLVEKAT